jgi:ketosteroid isomerase-like protein
MHANETVLRSVYAAFARGDIPAFLAFCAPDIRFRVPGDGLLGGNHSKDAFLEKLGPAMQAVAGSFREEIVSLIADGDGGAVLTAQEAARDGVVHRWNCVHWWRFRGDKLAEFHEFVDDPAAFDRAWHV